MVAGLFAAFGLECRCLSHDLAKNLIHHTGRNPFYAQCLYLHHLYWVGPRRFLGGELSHRYPNHLPKIFFILQLVLGAYGLLSYPLVRAVGTALTRVSDSALPFLLFFLLMVPTMAMGALLPLLVRYIHQRKGDVGGVLSRMHGFFLLGMALGTVLLIFILYFLFNCFVALFFASMFNALAAYLLFLKVNNKPLWGRRLS